MCGQCDLDTSYARSAERPAVQLPAGFPELLGHTYRSAFHRLHILEQTHTRCIKVQHFLQQCTLSVLTTDPKNNQYFMKIHFYILPLGRFGRHRCWALTGRCAARVRSDPEAAVWHAGQSGRVAPLRH